METEQQQQQQETPEVVPETAEKATEEEVHETTQEEKDEDEDLELEEEEDNDKENVSPFECTSGFNYRELCFEGANPNLLYEFDPSQAGNAFPFEAEDEEGTLAGTNGQVKLTKEGKLVINTHTSKNDLGLYLPHILAVLQRLFLSSSHPGISVEEGLRRRHVTDFLSMAILALDDLAVYRHGYGGSKLERELDVTKAWKRHMRPTMASVTAAALHHLYQFLDPEQMAKQLPLKRSCSELEVSSHTENDSQAATIVVE